MNTYLHSVKANCNWNEAEVISTIRAILDYHLGVPPAEFNYNGSKMTPMEFFKNEVDLVPEDYVEILSLMQEPYWEQCYFPVEDNWWKSAEYYNIPLDEFMSTLKRAVKKGYSVSIGGDVSEAGYDSRSQCAIVPSFDIPSEYIDENARQFRFSNKTTTDDHGVHLVGYKENDGKFWFLIKDSGSGSRNGANKGNYFWHEDYVKLKMMNYTIHRSAVEDILKKFKK
jgi:bleomycin hydrolase